MNSLEFINKEIKTTQKSYSVFDLDYMLFGRESDKKEAGRLLKKLKHLQQIKYELEAWYVVQGTIVEGEDGDGHYCYIETVYFTGEKGEKVKKGLYNDETR